MGFGTNNQLGNRTGITNQTSLADLFSGGPVGAGIQPGFGGTISPPGLGVQPGFGGGQPGGGSQPGGGQNQLFTLLQQLLGGQGGFQGGSNSPVVGNLVGGGNFDPKPPIGGMQFGRGGEGGFISPPGGGTPITSLSNPFASMINQQAIR